MDVALLNDAYLKFAVVRALFSPVLDHQHMLGDEKTMSIIVRYPGTSNCIVQYRSYRIVLPLSQSAVPSTSGQNCMAQMLSERTKNNLLIGWP